MNLVVGVKKHSDEYYPTYGIIREIVIIDNKLQLLLRLCKTKCYHEFYEAYCRESMPNCTPAESIDESK